MDGHQPSVLVTGGSGYLGQFVVEHLGLLGYKVGRVLGKPSATQQDHQLRKFDKNVTCRLCSLTIPQPRQRSEGPTLQHNGWEHTAVMILMIINGMAT